MVRSRCIIATPPGATIKEQLKDRGMSQKEFAARMDMSEKHISKLINGEVQLTPEVAIRLEFVLGVPAKFWNNLEAIYREKIIKAEAENTMDKDEEIAKKLPYNEMAKFGWVPETRVLREKVVNLRKYFEIVELSLLNNIQITRIACRRFETAPINIKGLMNIIPKIRLMTVMKAKEFCPKLKSMLAECGIALVFLPHLQGSFLQGASFIDGNKIVVGLTARGKDADKFWFSLFHELAHIILGHIGQTNGTSEDDEQAANFWSGDTLIPGNDFSEFIDRKCFSVSSIRAFAEKQGIAPGIVVGRLQKEGCIKHSALNELKDHYEIVV